MKEKSLRTDESMSFWQRLAAKLDISPDIVNGIMVEIRGQSNIVVHGCREILLYTPSEVRILLPGRVLCIVGNELYCIAYNAGVAEIDGVIKSLTYEEAGEK